MNINNSKKRKNNLLFGLLVKGSILSVLKFGFCIQKFSQGTPPELIWLDSDEIR